MKNLIKTPLFLAIFNLISCTSAPEVEYKNPPIVSENASFNFDEWIYDYWGFFFNGFDEITGELNPFEGIEGIDEDGNKKYFYNTKSSFYSTLNNIYTLPSEPGPLTTFREETGYRNTAAKLVSDRFLGIFIPGVIGTINVDLSKLGTNELARFGRKHKTNDDLISGYYKYEPIGNDSAAIWVDIWKWDNTNHRRDTLGSSRIKIGNKPWFHYPATSSWKEFNATINYRAGKENIQPDSINVLFVSSANFDFNNLFGCKGELGSTLWIDEIIISKTQQ